MRIDPDTCTDPDLLAAEVRRLQAVIESGEHCPYVTGRVTRYCTLTPFTLADAEREAVEWASKKMRLLGDAYDPERAATLRGLLERTRATGSVRRT